MKKVLVQCLLLLVITAGCKQIVLWKYGIRSPKTETPESILAFAKKSGQDPGNIYIFRDSLAYSHFMKDSIYKKASFSAIVFNARGFLVDYKDSASCQWSAAAHIRKLKKDTSYRVDESRKLPDVASSLVPLVRQSVEDSNAGGVDYTVVFTWARYIGKLNERLFCINEIAKNNPNAVIRVISLNVDMQKSWNLRKDQKVKLN